ncbi:hypothetical protein KO02_12195 [Sphingobacterium sp. ML3W]|uniref:hypothetical protein n=1 Tax=Sphingobacterium sp. ML3W TaxID=1538644 RepID=UPI0004F826DD|nr:hypothetical protein [Sphingobacterium sp. ML3W]AIM37367.1 hypothetical protein KO02_12195 [Sphingobacterium sp. ML3W]
MALQVKLQFQGQDRSGREIVLKDATGHQSFGRVTGYSSVQPGQIKAYHISFSRIDMVEKLWTLIDGTNSAVLVPSKIAMGIPFKITSSLFKDSTGFQDLASSIFSDGIVDINMYVQFDGLSGVVITKGASFVTGESFLSVYDADAILIDGVVYELDKNKDHNGYTVLYVLGSFDVDATSFDVLYRANDKAFLRSEGDYQLQKAVAITGRCNALALDTICVAMANKEAAKLYYDAEEYVKADELLVARCKLLKNVIDDNGICC